MSRPRVLLTGAGGFVGAHVLRHLLMNTDWHIVCPVTFRHRGNGDRIASSLAGNTDWRRRVDVIICDLAAPISTTTAARFGRIDYIFNVASESHVDRSITEPVPFIRTNTDLMLNILEYARRAQPRMVLQMSCYDTQTRVWTTAGLKTYEQVAAGDTVLSVDPETGQVIYSQVEKVIVQDYEGPMVRVDGRRTDFLVTPNHRMLIRARDGYEFVRADSLARRKTNDVARLVDHQPKAPSAGLGKLEAEGIGFFNAEDLLYVIGAFLGDGSTDINVAKHSHRTHFHIPNNKTANGGAARVRLVETLERMGVRHSVYDRAVYVGGKAWTAYFRQFGTGAHTKALPKWLSEADLSTTELKALFDGLTDTDGHRFKGNSIHYATVSEKLASDVVGIAVRLGLTATMGTRPAGLGNPAPDGHVIKGGESYRVVVNLGGEPRGLRREAISEEQYSGKIWCLTVPGAKNMLVERNGKFAFCGNTDEVFGPAVGDYRHHEWDSICPSNPYSASKAAQEAIAIAYWRTYSVPLVLTNTMNIVGEMQDPEKFVPRTMRALLRGERPTVHVSPAGQPGSRHYLHARNLADAWLWLAQNATVQSYADGFDRPTRFNVVGEREVDNIEMVRLIADAMGLSEPEIERVNFHASRPGHDLRYALDGSKLAMAGWKHPLPFEESLRTAVAWTLAHPQWLDV